MRDGHRASDAAPTAKVMLETGATEPTPTMEFALEGELDLSRAPLLTDELSRALSNVTRRRGGSTRLLLDLRNLTFIDSSGIQALLAAKRCCDQCGAGLSLRLGDTQVRRMLTLAGIAELIEVEDGNAAL